MKPLENKYVQALAYILLIMLNALSFYALYQVSQHERMISGGQGATGAEKAAEQSIFSRISQRFFSDKQAADEEAKVIAAKLSAAPKEPKFSRTSFLFQTPYIGSLAIPESWEGKYATRESGQSIDFLYALPGEAGTPIFTITLLAKKEWEKQKPAKPELQVIKELPEHVFVAKLHNTVIADQRRAEEYQRMTNEAKASWNSFRSYAQPKN